MFLRLLIIFVSMAFFAKDPGKSIITIGDSHGALETGWVNQLKKLRPDDSVMNFAISGNTTGFDNLGREALNELKNLGNQLDQANKAFDKIDYVIILLGTNDCKAVFDSLQDVVPENLEKIVSTVKKYKFRNNAHPVVVLVTPPPIANDSVLEAKYLGSKARLQKLLPYYSKLAERYQCLYVDCNTALQKDFNELTKDGIHLKEAGYERIAQLIDKKIK